MKEFTEDISHSEIHLTYDALTSSVCYREVISSLPDKVGLI